MRHYVCFNTLRSKSS